jgi:hypothetical protein
MWTPARPRLFLAVGLTLVAAACSGEPDGANERLDASAGAAGSDANAPGNGGASGSGSGGAKGGARAGDTSTAGAHDASARADAEAPDGPDAAPAPDAGPVVPPNPCKPLAFPSGITIATFEDAAMSAVYDDISDTNCFPRPVCWIDVDRLEDPRAGITYDLSVQLSPHFQLSELVDSELPYSRKVLVSPALVEHLETYRAAAGGKAVRITSGYRSPQHQRTVCQGICGMDCCSGGANPCACRSRHEWGDGADIASDDPPSLYQYAEGSGFGFCLAEVGHLHVDMNPCGAGCPQ